MSPERSKHFMICASFSACLYLLEEPGGSLSRHKPARHTGKKSSRFVFKTLAHGRAQVNTIFRLSFTQEFKKKQGTFDGVRFCKDFQPSVGNIVHADVVQIHFLIFIQSAMVISKSVLQFGQQQQDFNSRARL